MFAAPENLESGLSNAALNIAEARARCLAEGGQLEDSKGLKKEEAPALSPESLSAEYPLFSGSLFNLVQSAETRMGMKKQTK